MCSFAYGALSASGGSLNSLQLINSVRVDNQHIDQLLCSSFEYQRRRRRRQMRFGRRVRRHSRTTGDKQLLCMCKSLQLFIDYPDFSSPVHGDLLVTTCSVFVICYAFA